MIAAFFLAALVQGAQALPAPTFTDAQVQQVIACADGPQPARCVEEPKKQAILRCMRELPVDANGEAFNQCAGAITDRCVRGWASTTSQMNRRGILVCAAQTRAALRFGIDDWFARAGERMHPSLVAQYRTQLVTVDTRIQDQTAEVAADGQPDVEVRSAGVKNGIWESFARFLWQSERKNQ